MENTTQAIKNDLQISSYIHCGKCLAVRPPTTTPQNWGKLEVGFTRQGIQVWCKRHKCNVMHIDFEGNRHPANTTAAPAASPKGGK